MAITSNVGGILKKLETVHTNVSGTLKELNTIHANVSGTLKLIHVGEKCLDINISSLTSSKAAGTYYGTTSPSGLTPSASLYVPGIQTLVRVVTDLDSLSSDFDQLKTYYKNNPNGTGSGFTRNSVNNTTTTPYVIFASYGGAGSNGTLGGGGSSTYVRAEKDGDYLRFYLLKYSFSWSSTNGGSYSYTVSDITTPLKAKLYYK